MVIKYCPKCEGKPYTKDYSITVCSTCGSALHTEIVNEEDLRNRTEMFYYDDKQFDDFSADEFEYEKETSVFGDSEPNQLGFGDYDPIDGFGEGTEKDSKLPSEYHNSFIDKSKEAQEFPSTPSRVSRTNPNNSSEIHANAKNIGTVIRGKITNYTNSKKENSDYKRLFIKKIVDAIVYNQRLDDTLHTFTIRINNGIDTFGHQIYADIPVNVHGIVSGGIQLVDNIEVEITGKYCKGILMAKRISVINNGFKSPIKFQHSAKAILYGILTVFALAFLIYIGISSNDSFFQNIGLFLKTWLIAALIVMVLYFLVAFSRFGLIARMAAGKQRGFPLIGILLVSLIAALLFTNCFGIGASVGSALSGVLSSAISFVVLLVVLLLVFRLLF